MQSSYCHICRKLGLRNRPIAGQSPSEAFTFLESGHDELCGCNNGSSTDCIAFIFGLMKSHVAGVERSHAASDIKSKPRILDLHESMDFAFSAIRCL
jgi:hypothetical protein